MGLKTATWRRSVLTQFSSLPHSSSRFLSKATVFPLGFFTSGGSLLLSNPPAPLFSRSLCLLVFSVHPSPFVGKMLPLPQKHLLRGIWFPLLVRSAFGSSFLRLLIWCERVFISYCMTSLFLTEQILRQKGSASFRSLFYDSFLAALLPPTGCLCPLY